MENNTDTQLIHYSALSLRNDSWDNNRNTLLKKEQVDSKKAVRFEAKRSDNEEEDEFVEEVVP